MKAVLIDAENKTIAPIDTDGELGSLYALCKCETIDIIHIADGVCMVIDGEGAINGTPCGFDYQGYGSVAGNAVLAGEDNLTGNFVDLDFPVEAFAKLVTFQDFGEGGKGAEMPQIISFDNVEKFFAYLSSLREDANAAKTKRGKDLERAARKD